MGKKKLFNDPIYGLFDFKDEIIYDIIDHPHFQRLRRIKQMGLNEYIYPGATHSRFQHAIGATHLLNNAIEVLLSKGIAITDEERMATSIAILCHDMGHGPFSHTLEGQIVKMKHEEITKIFLENFCEEFGSVMNVVIQIFNNTYHKNFLHQLISSQLDMDRLDYLSRDSYYTGVAEGVIGYDRIIKMLNVVNNDIVVEEKGINSIEKFLVARYLMYSQVYLHKTCISAEKMLLSAINRAKYLIEQGFSIEMSDNLFILLKHFKKDFDKEDFTYYFSLLDDYDVWDFLKRGLNQKDDILKILCKSLLNRKLFSVSLQLQDDIEQTLKSCHNSKMTDDDFDKSFLVFQVKETISSYSKESQEILILTKSGEVRKLSEYTAAKHLLSRFEVLNFAISPK